MCIYIYIYICIYQCLEREQQRQQSSAHPSGAQGQDRRQGTQTETHEVSLAIRKVPFTLRVTKHWHKLLRVIVEFPSSDRVKTQLDMDMGSLFLLTLLEQKGWVSRGLCQPQL